MSTGWLFSIWSGQEGSRRCAGSVATDCEEACLAMQVPDDISMSNRKFTVPYMCIIGYDSAPPPVPQ